MSISSDEVTFLILRYFKECGFEHSHFTYINESSIDASQITGYQIPPGALITLLQKGLLYIQLERTIKAKKKPTDVSFGSQITLLNAALREGSVPTSNDDKQGQREPQEPSIPLDSSNSITLSEHTGNVICCQWTKDGHFLATGSSDNTAIIWDMQNPDQITQLPLAHGDAETSKEGDHQVSSLDWSPDSNFLATGCSDGTVHVFDKQGSLIWEKKSKKSHAVHVVKFNISGTHLIVGSASTKIKILSADSGEKIRSFKASAGILDASWRTDTAFAVSCDDGLVGIFDSLDAEPVWLKGHTEPTNCVVWDPNGSDLLASCSNDKTVRIWARDKEALVLSDHQSPVYSLKWSKSNILASASFNATVILWDPATGNPIHILKGHQKPIYALSFSPDEKFIASGSSDQVIKFWDVATGNNVCSCLGKQIIFDLQYDPTGKYVAVCFEGGNVVIIKTDSVLQNQKENTN